MITLREKDKKIWNSKATHVMTRERRKEQLIKALRVQRCSPSTFGIVLNFDFVFDSQRVGKNKIDFPSVGPKEEKIFHPMEYYLNVNLINRDV